MPFSATLGGYLALSNRGKRVGERVLRRRLAEGLEDPKRIDERRGRPSVARPDGDLMWLHAASVGESLALLEIVRRMGEERPDLSFLLTTGTISSARMLERRLPARTVHQFVPLDIRPWIRRFLDHWRPQSIVLTESELWPGLLHEASSRTVPIVLLNARLSDRSYRRWRLARRSAGDLLSRIRHIQAQDEATANRLIALGLPAGQVEVTGTLKEGSGALPHDERERARMAAVLAGRPCWVAASTHEGEDGMAAIAHARASRSWQRLLLILVPRHPERGPAVADALRADGWKVSLRTQEEAIAADTQIYVADTMGEMGLWYRLCPVALVAGSLVQIGGHNPFEPAALGSAILHGPHVENFQGIYERLAEAGAAREVDMFGLGNAVAEVLEPDVAARMAHAAWEVCSEGADVTERAMDLLFAVLDGVD